MRPFHPFPVKAIWLIAIMLCCGISYAQPGTSTNNYKNKEYYMSTIEKNKEIIQKIYEQALNKRDLEILNNYISDEFVGIAGKKGVAAFQEPAQMLIKAMPD